MLNKKGPDILVLYFSGYAIDRKNLQKIWVTSQSPCNDVYQLS